MLWDWMLGLDALALDALGSDALGLDALGLDALALDALGSDALGLNALGLDASWTAAFLMQIPIYLGQNYAHFFFRPPLVPFTKWVPDPQSSRAP